MAFTTAPRFFGGIDENGLGPRLGPLVVTGAMGEALSVEAAFEIQGPPSQELAKLIGDSKKLVGFGHSALGEAWARVMCRIQKGVDPGSPGELLRAISLDDMGTLTRDCPASGLPLCWGNLALGESSDGLPEERFQTGEEVLEKVERAWRLLESRGIRLMGFRSVIMCPHALNQARDREISRLDMDLYAMERLFLAMERRAKAVANGEAGGSLGPGGEAGVLSPMNPSISADSLASSNSPDPGKSSAPSASSASSESSAASLPGGPSASDRGSRREGLKVDGLLAHCGKVGGLTFYGGHFRLFHPDVLGTLQETRDLSRYASGNSEIRFVLDAEPKHQLVGLASVVGKWLRDMLMDRILAHLRREHPEWPLASGYNDKKTKELIALSQDLRVQECIPDDCFMRR